MKRYLILALFAFGVVASGGCSPRTIKVDIASENERIPYPKFVARDLTQKHAWPDYTEIKVYEVVDECLIPNCPLVWNVVVSAGRSPREIVYGALPSFGAMTIAAPKELVAGKTYHMHLDRAENTAATGRGGVHFTVNGDGTVSILDTETAQ